MMLPTFFLLITDVLVVVPQVSFSLDDGLARTPPLGWRSWNLYEGSIDQDKMTAIMNGIVRRNRRDPWTGQRTSLCDLGYCHVGLDDVWQDCDSPMAAPGMHYHDRLGNPLVNSRKFPSLSNMTAHAHRLGLTAGWYANNCACSDHCRNPTECHVQIRQDVRALLHYGFDALKIDGCGNETDLVVWNHHLQKYPARPILVENCHGDNPQFKPNRTLPPALGCPYHFYRVSQDIRNHYASIMANLAAVQPYHQRNESYPGCWAYPDMLQVGVPGGLSPTELRTHFGSWAIVSSPLILSHDVNNASVMDAVWPVIANREVLAVNQAYAGDSGGAYLASNTSIRLWYPPPKNSKRKRQSVLVPIYQYFSKPLSSHDGRVAVLLLNSANTTLALVARFEDIPGLECPSSTCHVRDIWNHVDLGYHNGSWSVRVESHDAVFFVLDPSRNEDHTPNSRANQQQSEATALT